MTMRYFIEIRPVAKLRPDTHYQVDLIMSDT
jgi:hypothetical protein